MKISESAKEFAEYMMAIKAQAKEPEECEGCDACEDDDTDEELAAMVRRLQLIDNAEDMIETTLLVLMIVAKMAGLGKTSAEAHALWVDA